MGNIGTPIAMSDYICRIERLENGYEVELFDPEIDKENSKNKTYNDPFRGYAFESLDAVIAFLKENLDKARKKDDYGDAFKSAVKEKK